MSMREVVDVLAVGGDMVIVEDVIKMVSAVY